MIIFFISLSYLNMLFSFVMFCAISYDLYNIKNVKNTYGGVLLLVKLQAEAPNREVPNCKDFIYS